MPDYNFHIGLMWLGYGDYKQDNAWSTINELVYARSKQVTVTRIRHVSDAMVCRTRGRCIGTAMLTDANVFFFYDRDLSCDIGDMTECCRLAHEKQAIVGGAYAKKRMHTGISSVFASDGGYEFGVKDDVLIPASNIAGGFMAIPRSAIEKMQAILDIDTGTIRIAMVECMETHNLKVLLELHNMAAGLIRDEGESGILMYHNLFRPIEQPKVDGQGDYSYQPEDYSFCKRARYCGIDLYLARRCNMTHIGDYGYQLVDSCPQPKR